jgi:hypothetical protein
VKKTTTKLTTKLTTKARTNSARPSKSAPAAAAVATAFAPIVKAFAKAPGVTSGKMMASIGLKLGGKIFVMHVRGKLVAKLPKRRVDELVASGLGERFDPRHDGRVMKEWLAVDEGRGDWLALAREAHAFVEAAGG